MYASIVTGQIQAEGWDELAGLYDDLVVPLIGKITGLTNVYLLRVPDTDDGMGIAMYNTLDDAVAAGESEEYRDVMAKMAPLFAGQPDRRVYEVIAQG